MSKAPAFQFCSEGGGASTRPLSLCSTSRIQSRVQVVRDGREAVKPC